MENVKKLSFFGKMKKVISEYDEKYNDPLKLNKTEILWIFTATLLILLSVILFYTVIIKQLNIFTFFPDIPELSSLYVKYKNTTFLTAFVFGFLSFLSPYILSLLVPYFCYFAYISNVTLEKTIDKDTIDGGKKEIICLLNKLRVFLHSIAFIIAFWGNTLNMMMIFTLFDEQDKILILGKLPFLKFGGIPIILFGICSIILAIKPLWIRHRGIPGVMISMGTFILAIIFSFGWLVYCTDPYFYFIFVQTALSKNALWGFLLMLSYTLGLGLPFVLSALIWNWVLVYSKISKYRNSITFACGVLLSFTGIFMFFSQFFKFLQSP